MKAYSEELKNKDEFSCSEGDSEANRKKNRYKDILPFNYSRVVLSEFPGIPGSGYINANYINYETDENLVAGAPFKQYIATQGCVGSTRADFWQMVWQEQSRLIVMTTKVRCEMRQRSNNVV